MKTSVWAIVGITAAGAGGSGYVLMPERTVALTAAATHEIAAVHEPANAQSAFATDLARAPITAPLAGDPFGNWAPAPKPAPKPAAAAPARPVIPAFPYTYAGTLRKGSEASEAFLLRGGKELVPVRAGAVLDGAWRVEALTGDRIEVTYLPAGERMTMLLASLTGERSSPVANAAASSVTAAYEETGVGPANVEPAPVPARRAPIAVANNAPTGGLAAQPMAAPAKSQSAAAAVSGGTGSMLGSQPPVNSAPLGSEAPTQGSMPVGPAPSGTFPQGETPTGKLGH